MKSQARLAFLCGLGWLVLSASVAARTWYVRQDGTGDYTRIQPAIEGAMAGDTLRIGAGRYADYFEYELWSTYITNVYVAVVVDDLTLIGEGPEATVIGSETFHSEPPLGPIGIVAQQEITQLRLRDLAIENLRYGAYMAQGSLDILDCEVRSCGIGLYCFTSQGMQVERCDFLDNINDGLFAHAPARDIYIMDCYFDNQTGNLAFAATPNAHAYACHFTGGDVGIQFEQHASGGIHNCILEGITNAAIGIISSDVVLERNQATGGGESLVATSGSHISGRENIFTDNWYASIRVCNSTFDFHDNEIYNGGGWSVLVECYGSPPVQTIDLTGNYWGTQDAGQIAEWIRDMNDNPWPMVYAVVDFEPYLLAPTSTEQQSWGRVKALYR
jgi:hypothetical protein